LLVNARATLLRSFALLQHLTSTHRLASVNAKSPSTTTALATLPTSTATLARANARKANTTLARPLHLISTPHYANALVN